MQSRWGSKSPHRSGQQLWNTQKLLHSSWSESVTMKTLSWTWNFHTFLGQNKWKWNKLTITFKILPHYMTCFPCSLSVMNESIKCDDCGIIMMTNNFHLWIYIIKEKLAQKFAVILSKVAVLLISLCQISLHNLCYPV